MMRAMKQVTASPFPQSVSHRKECRGAAYREDGGEDEQHVFHFEQNGIGIHDIVAARAELHETELLLQKHQNDAQQQSDNATRHGNQQAFIQEYLLYQAIVGTH